MYLNENRSAEICFLNRGNPLNQDCLNRGFTVSLYQTIALRRKSIGPFVDFSNEMAFFKRLEKYLKLIKKFSIYSPIAYTNGECFSMSFAMKISMGLENTSF